MAPNTTTQSDSALLQAEFGPRVDGITLSAANNVSQTFAFTAASDPGDHATGACMRPGRLADDGTASQWMQHRLLLVAGACQAFFAGQELNHESHCACTIDPGFSKESFRRVEHGRRAAAAAAA